MIVEARTGREVLLLVFLGLVGALIGALVITPPFAGRLALYGFSLPGFLISLLGSILLLALAFNLVGDALREEMDPTQKGRG